MDQQRSETSKIVTRIKSGEKSAFDILVDMYKHKAFSIAFTISRNVDDAKDLVQEAFVKAYISISSFKEGSSFYTWFYRILINVSKDYLKRKARQEYLFKPLELNSQSDEGKRNLLEKLSDSGLAPDKWIVNKEIKQVTEGAIALLPVKQRLVFNLRYYEGMKFEEIARILNCRTSTAKVNFFKALKNLKKRLRPYMVLDGG
jgi:RNA polymerase sigma-70 factor (ECF subfamily)